MQYCEILQYLLNYFVMLQYQSIAILCNSIAIQYYWNHPWPRCFSALERSVLDVSCVCCICLFEQWMYRCMLSSCRYRRWLSPDWSQNGNIFNISVTVIVVIRVVGWGWCSCWTSTQVCLSLYNCCVQLVAWCVMRRRVSPMKPIVRLVGCNSVMLRAYHAHFWFSCKS